MSSKSAAIVSFLGNLLPLYRGEQHEVGHCARSLLDGTLVVPVDEGVVDEQQGWVHVLWQGDAARSSEVLGSDITALALVRYVELRHFGQSGKHQALVLEDLARHFRIKTGCDIELPCEPASVDLTEAVSRAVGRLGESAVINVLLKTTGLP